MSDDRYSYQAIQVAGSSSWEVVNPSGVTVKVYTGDSAESDATSHADRANRRAGLARG